MHSLAFAFRALRHTLGLSVEEIAAIGRVAPTYWQRIEDGAASPSPLWTRATVQRIAEHQTT